MRIFAFISMLGLIVLFQNCSNVNFSDLSSVGSTKATDGDDLDREFGEDPMGQTGEVPPERQPGEDPAGDTPIDTGTAICKKVESLHIGQTIVLNGVTVTIVDLVLKDGNEVVGFKVVSSQNITYLIKAGRDAFYDSDFIWVNPNGISGSKARGISHVTFCIGDTSQGIPDASLSIENNPSVPK